MSKLDRFTSLATLLAVLLACFCALAVTAAILNPDLTRPVQPAGGTTHFSNLEIPGTLDVTGQTTLGALTYSTQVWTGNTTFTGTVAANVGLSVDSPAFTVADTSGNVRTGGTLAVEGATTLTGTVTAVGAVNVGGALITTGASTASTSLTTPKIVLAAAQSISPTNGTMITPTSSFVQLTTAAASGHTLGQCPTAGMITVIENTINAAFTITDTGTAVLSGDLALGQYDTVSLICASAAGSWLQIATSNN